MIHRHQLPLLHRQRGADAGHHTPFLPLNLPLLSVLRGAEAHPAALLYSILGAFSGETRCRHGAEAGGTGVRVYSERLRSILSPGLCMSQIRPDMEDLLQTIRGSMPVIWFGAHAL